MEAELKHPSVVEAERNHTNMVEEKLMPTNMTPFERWALKGMEHCGCKNTEQGHDLWRHPIQLPLIGFSLMVGLAPEHWITSTKESWQGGHYPTALAKGIGWTLLWLASLILLGVFLSLALVSAPFSWVLFKIQTS